MRQPPNLGGARNLGVRPCSDEYVLARDTSSSQRSATGRVQPMSCQSGVPAAEDHCSPGRAGEPRPAETHARLWAKTRAANLVRVPQVRHEAVGLVDHRSLLLRGRRQGHAAAACDRRAERRVRRGDAAVDVVEERKHLGSPRGQRAQVSACALGLLQGHLVPAIKPGCV